MVLKDLPLISVVVISYNSAYTIEETLQSIYVQSYENLELIITDDCSSDSTLDICRRFVDDKGARFVNVRIHSSEKNTGTSVNCNRGCRLAKGEWVKLIAGDDILLPHCITSFYEHILRFPSDYFLFSNVELFGEIVNNSIFEVWKRRVRLFDYYKSAHQQNLYLTSKGNFVPAPSSFMKLSIFRQLGGFDESILFIEDHPFWIKVTGAGYKLSFIPEKLVRYRISNQSISLSSNRSEIYNISKTLFKQKYQIRNPLLPLVINYFDQLGNDKIKNNLLLKFLIVTGFPFHIYRRLLYIVNRSKCKFVEIK